MLKVLIVERAYDNTIQGSPFIYIYIGEHGGLVVERWTPE